MSHRGLDLQEELDRNEADFLRGVRRWCLIGLVLCLALVVLLARTPNV